MKDKVLNKEDEQRMVRAVLLNDRNAILQLIRLYERLVVSLVFKMIDRDADREDLCQDVFMKVFSNLKEFKFESKLSTWIAQITYHLCLNFLQKKKNLFIEDVFKPLNGYGTDFETHDNTELITKDFSHQETEMPDEILYQNETNRNLHAAIEKLPVLFRTLIELYHIEEMSYAEISTITKLPMNTVKSYLFRARKMLKDSLIHQFKIVHP